MLRSLSFLLIGIVAISCAGGTPGTSPPGQKSMRNTDTEAVLGQTWQWVATATSDGKITAKDPTRYTILFAADGQVQAQFDCNRGHGGYRMADGKLTMGVLMATRMACPADSQDSRFMKDLQTANAYYLAGDNLFLKLPGKTGTMQFRPAP
jgi:heat shock protein HslJ